MPDALAARYAARSLAAISAGEREDVRLLLDGDPIRLRDFLEVVAEGESAVDADHVVAVLALAPGAETQVQGGAGPFVVSRPP